MEINIIKTIKLTQAEITNIIVGHLQDKNTIMHNVPTKNIKYDVTDGTISCVIIAEE